MSDTLYLRIRSGRIDWRFRMKFDNSGKAPNLCLTISRQLKKAAIRSHPYNNGMAFPSEPLETENFSYSKESEDADDEDSSTSEESRRSSQESSDSYSILEESNGDSSDETSFSSEATVKTPTEEQANNGAGDTIGTEIIFVNNSRA